MPSDLILALQERLNDLPQRPLEAVDVAVLDSGVDATHPDLAGRIARAFSLQIEGTSGQILAEEGAANRDSYGHGTAVASIIAAIASNARIVDYRVLRSDNSGNGDALVAALRHALQSGCRVINMSLAAQAAFAPRLQELCEQAYRAGQLIVAASRNMPLVDYGYPAEFTSVISVDRTRFPDPFHVRYLRNSVIEFAGQGDEVVVAAAGGGRTTKTGTSFATPAITGLVTLIVGAWPELRPFEVKSLLRAFAVK